MSHAVSLLIHHTFLHQLCLYIWQSKDPRFCLKVVLSKFCLFFWRSFEKSFLCSYLIKSLFINKKEENNNGTQQQTGIFYELLLKWHWLSCGSRSPLSHTTPLLLERWHNILRLNTLLNPRIYQIKFSLKPCLKGAELTWYYDGVCSLWCDGGGNM